MADPRWQRTTPGRDRDPAGTAPLPMPDIRIRFRLRLRPGCRAIVLMHLRSLAVLSRRPWTSAAPWSRVGNARRNTRPADHQGEPMSVYRVTEVIGVSEQSWEDAAREAVNTAAGTVRDLRVAEVIRQDVTIENGQVKNFRVRLALSFKYDTGD
jgi:dodecin